MVRHYNDWLGCWRKCLSAKFFEATGSCEVVHFFVKIGLNWLKISCCHLEVLFQHAALRGPVFSYGFIISIIQFYNLWNYTTVTGLWTTIKQECNKITKDVDIKFVMVCSRLSAVGIDGRVSSLIVALIFSYSYMLAEQVLCYHFLNICPFHVIFWSKHWILTYMYILDVSLPYST